MTYEILIRMANWQWQPDDQSPRQPMNAIQRFKEVLLFYPMKKLITALCECLDVQVRNSLDSNLLHSSIYMYIYIYVYIYVYKCIYIYFQW